MGAYKPRTNNEWGFLGAIAGQTVCATVLDVVVLWKYFGWVTPLVYQVPRSYSIPVNCGLLLLAVIYQAILTLDSLRTRNNVQMYNICICNILLLVLTIMSYEQTSQVITGLSTARAMGTTPLVNLSIDLWANVSPVLLSSCVVTGIVSIALFFYGYKLHKEFAWAIYRHVSGSRQMRQKFLAYKVLIVMVKMELYLFIAFLVLYGLVDVHFEVPEFPLTVCLLLAELLQFGLGPYFMKTENVSGALVVIVLRVAQIAYLISRIVLLCGHGPRANTPMKNEMMLYACSSLAFNAIICVNSVLCTLNFGHGLKPLLAGETKDARESYQFHNLGYEPVHQFPKSPRFDLE
ncbi:unnamed protein product [Periconia digitata]|uniref:TRP C-terminal domain-containing protein n=1 Tax=Periconia digitata TaxID=1303443 RepID=A0A9W4U944_9PLEO|nr:unnamed protein product [Periconia digitata]